MPSRSFSASSYSFNGQEKDEHAGIGVNGALKSAYDEIKGLVSKMKAGEKAKKNHI